MGEWDLPAFAVERDFNETISKEYMEKHWTDSIVYSLLYVLVIFSGQEYMKHRPRYDLRRALIMWSTSLAIFSIIGTLRTLPELVFSVTTRGIQNSVCAATSFFKGASGLWAYLFALSKVVELGDTVFIVLRKQPLQLLHWYHHVTVLIYTWYSYSYLSPQAPWFGVMNFIVHSFMYSYYSLRAMGVYIHKKVSMAITCLQMTQMFVGCGINILIYQIKQRGEDCFQTYSNLQVSFIMYISYLGLFIHFFYLRYFSDARSKSNDKLKKQS